MSGDLQVLFLAIALNLVISIVILIHVTRPYDTRAKDDLPAAPKADRPRLWPRPASGSPTVSPKRKAVVLDDAKAWQIEQDERSSSVPPS